MKKVQKFQTYFHMILSFFSSQSEHIGKNSIHSIIVSDICNDHKEKFTIV